MAQGLCHRQSLSNVGYKNTVPSIHCWSVQRLICCNAHIKIQIEEFERLSIVGDSWQDDGVDRQTV